MSGHLDYTSQEHPDEAELSAYINRSLGEADRTRIEAHLAKCDDCRMDVVEVMRLFRPQPRRRVWYVAAGLAAAALASILLFAPSANHESGPGGPVLRGPVTDVPATASAVQIVHPREGATLDAEDARFTWRETAPGASYRLTLTDETGDVVWSVSIADTTAYLPSDSSLSREQTYFWYVDALMPDGRSTTSGVHEFKVAR
jgi:putative zinc finger protein